MVDLVTFLTNQKAVRVHGLVRTFMKTTDSINGIRNISAPDFCTFQIELTNNILVTATINSHIAASSFNQEVLVCSSTGHLLVRGGDLFGRKSKGLFYFYEYQKNILYT